jgi:hypothetical protein
MTLGRFEEEGFLDGGDAGPLDEFFEELFGGFLFGLVVAMFLEFDAAGVEMTPAEADDVLGENAQVFALFFKFGGVQLIAIHEGLGVVEGKEAEKGIGEAIGSVGEFAGIGGEIAGLLEDLLVAEPIAIAALLPFGQVLGVNGAATEMVGEDGFDFGEFVEPLGKLHGGLAFVEGLVELFAKGTGQMGDFADAFGIGVR